MGFWEHFNDEDNVAPYIYYQLITSTSDPYRKKRKKLKRKLKKFAPADAEPLKAIFFCEDYEQRSMLINTLWDKITFEVEVQYKIIEQFDPHTEDYQRARARIDELDEERHFITDCYDI